MSDRPLTPLMYDVLELLSKSREPMTGNQIGLGLGLRRGQRKRGPWSGPTGPAQRAIPALIGLRRRGLIRYARRVDGLSGTADRITDEGRQYLRDHPRPQETP